jgi:uncharacterized phage protein gp47/JayE
MPGTDAFLWPNTEFVFMRSVAGMVHMNMQYLEWISRQRFATTADGDELDNHGRPWGLTRKAATKASGNVVVTGTALQTITAGTLMQRSDGVQFAVVADITLDTFGAGTGLVEAVVAGAAGNTAINAAMTLVEADAAITDIAVDEIGIGSGADNENDESYRARILFRMRNPPRGGSQSDYVAWAWSVAGVTRVWVDPLAYGPGTVALWFMSDGSTANGIPTATLVQDVDDYIETVRPATARVIVAAPLAAEINIKIAGITPSEATQALIEAELSDLFRRRVDPSMPSKAFTLRNSAIWQAVARITGDSTHTIAQPLDTTFATGYIPVMGSICYI